ncbi:MAG: pentapeptide repeat-containing protein [Desulfobaccales bacterium]
MSSMSRLAWVFLGVWLLCLAPALAQEKPPEPPWTGKFADGRVMTRTDLDQILKDHKLWFESDKKEGKKADLSGSDLRWANMGGVFLLRAILIKAQLNFANLNGADLRDAILTKAELIDSNLSKASLSGADLTGTKLSGANLIGADLSAAQLFEADLSGADLLGADLEYASMIGANLSGKTNLTLANLTAVHLNGANLKGAVLMRTNLSGEADLTKADLSGAYLSAANLNGAHLGGANLSSAYLGMADLTRADLSGADLSGAEFMPKAGSLPAASGLLGIKGLDSLKFIGTYSYALTELREIFKKAGMRYEERQVNYSLNRNRRVNALQEIREKAKEGKIGLIRKELAQLDILFQSVFFEWTCDYGMTPSKPLIIMFIGLFGFTVPYFLALRSRNPETGIWLLLPSDRVLDQKLKDHPIKLTFSLPSPPFPTKKGYRFRGRFWRCWRVLRLAFYFSLLSAFNIGWRELNVGTWISRLQMREYNLRATGWVRMVSGFQSLLSVYMLALWVYTYFGHPFEW